MGFCPQLGGVGPCPAQCIWQGSGFAADQTNAMLAVVRADDESLVPPQAAGLALSVARPLPTETASLGFGGSPVGCGDKNSRFAFFGTSMWGWYHYPPTTVAVSEQPGAGFISAEKAAFSEWVHCADGRAVPSCTQCFFGTSVWGVVSLPSACASCCRNAGRPQVTAAYSPFLCRLRICPVWAEYPLGGHTRHPVSKPRTQRLTGRNTASSQGRW